MSNLKEKLLEAHTELYRLFKNQEKRAEHWGDWKLEKSPIPGMTWEDLDKLSGTVAAALCEIDGEGEPWYIKAWHYCNALGYKRLEEIMQDPKIPAAKGKKLPTISTEEFLRRKQLDKTATS